MRSHARHAAAVLLAGCSLALAACTAITAIRDQTRYYVLSPSTETRDASRSAISSAGIGVGPVLLPGYLDRLPMVTRGVDDEVEISMYHRWAEPLDRGIAQALADDLASQIGNDRIAVFPWRGGVARVLDYQVIVVVLRFDGSPGREVTLDARWRLLGQEGRELALKRSTIKQPIAREGYQSVVRGMSRAIATLAREIGSEIQSRAGTAARPS
jgi:uncharacterized lipoprotein YmbA